MKRIIYKFKIIGQILFVIILLSTSSARSLDKYDNAESVSDYFSGILMLNKNQYEESLKYFKELKGLESSHINYSVKFLYSLINSGNFKDAINYSKKLEKQKLDNYESNIILGIFYLKNSNNKLAAKYFLRAKNKNTRFIFNKYVSSSIYNWSNLSTLDQAFRFKNSTLGSKI